MTQFNPPRRQATETIVRALTSLTEEIAIDLVKAIGLEKLSDTPISYPHRKFSKNYVGLPEKVRLFTRVFHAIGVEGRKSLDKAFRFEVVSNDPTCWSVVIKKVASFDSAKTICVAIHAKENSDTKKPMIAFDVMAVDDEDVPSTEVAKADRKNLTVEQLRRAYTAYLKWGGWLLPHEPTMGMIGLPNRMHEMTIVLSGLGTASLSALIVELNAQVMVEEYELILGDVPVKGENGRDDDVEWTLTHYRAIGRNYFDVHYVLCHRSGPKEFTQLSVLERMNRFSENCRLRANKYDNVLTLNRRSQ